MSRIASATLAAPRRIAGATGIAQDNIIFAAILFAFVVWITSKGELSTYIAFFTPGATQGPVTDPITATPSTGATPTSVTGAVGGTLANVPSQVTGLASGTASGIGGAIYQAIIGQPMKLIQGFGHTLGIPGM